MKILKIYFANNGDIFFRHDQTEPIEPGEAALLMAKAARSLDALDVETEVVRAVHHDARNGIPEHLSYRQIDGTFIGDAGVHVTAKYLPFNDLIYLHKASRETENERLAHIIAGGML